MRRARRFTGLALVPLLSLGGCGTYLNFHSTAPLRGPRLPFGGVVMGFALVRPLAVVDLPFSLVGDVLTLPFAIHYQLTHSDEEGGDRGGPAAGDADAGREDEPAAGGDAPEHEWPPPRQGPPRAEAR